MAYTSASQHNFHTKINYKNPIIKDKRHQFLQGSMCYSEPVLLLQHNSQPEGCVCVQKHTCSLKMQIKLHSRLSPLQEASGDAAVQLWNAERKAGRCVVTASDADSPFCANKPLKRGDTAICLDYFSEL